MTLFQILLLAAVVFYIARGLKLKTKVRTKIADYRKDAQEFSIELRERGFRKVPKILDAFVLDGDPRTFFGGLREMLGEGPDQVLKELDATFDRVLESKLGSPEGRDVLRAKLEVAEKVAVGAIKVAKAVAPVVIAAL